MAYLIKIIENFHDLGFIHRDLKPGNIMVDNKGHLVIIDLGSIKIMDRYKHKQFLHDIELKYNSSISETESMK